MSACQVATGTQLVEPVLNLLAGRACAGATEPGFAVTEFSISLAQARPAAVRCLAEVIVRQPSRRKDHAALKRAGVELLTVLSAPSGHVEAFLDLYRRVYEPARRSGAAPHHRFGLAVEWCGERSPTVKAYFDMYANGRRRAEQTLALVVERLELADVLSRMHRSDGAPPPGMCRGVGVDFAADGALNARLYLAGRYFTWADVELLLISLGQGASIGALRSFHRLVLNGLPPTEPLRSTLLGLVVSSALPSGSAVLKLDAFLPALKVDDRASARATSELCTTLGIDASVLPTASSLVAGVLRPCETQRVQQFLSLDVLPGGTQKVNVYLRHAELQGSHDGAHRPRKKPEALVRLDTPIELTIGYLEGQRAAGFAEALHRMRFPLAAGFGGTADERVGSAFQRALIAEALLDAAAAGFHIDWNGIDTDARDIISLRSNDVAGGWRYFPDLPELPPDADDLAMALRMLVRAGHPYVAEYCDDPLRLALSGIRDHPGAVGTWIVDPDDLSDTARKIRKAIAALWGDALDVEVVANLLHALVLYDAARFRNRITAGIEYVASRQRPSGTWEATWYHGPAYGTFACTRFLASAAPHHHALPHVASMLEATQKTTAAGATPPAHLPTLRLPSSLRHSSGTRLRDSPGSVTEPLPTFSKDRRGTATGTPTHSSRWTRTESRRSPGTAGRCCWPMRARRSRQRCACRRSAPHGRSSQSIGDHTSGSEGP